MLKVFRTYILLNQANDALAWTETIRVLNEWFQDLDTDNDAPLDVVSTMTQVSILFCDIFLG
jgi:hypothetical protein